jgi:hypothetical protein
MSENKNAIATATIVKKYEMYTQIQDKISKINDVINFIEDTNLVSQLQSIVIRYQDDAAEINNDRIDQIKKEGPSFHYEINHELKMVNFLITFL